MPFVHLDTILPWYLTVLNNPLDSKAEEKAHFWVFKTYTQVAVDLNNVKGYLESSTLLRNILLSLHCYLLSQGQSYGSSLSIGTLSLCIVESGNRRLRHFVLLIFLSFSSVLACYKWFYERMKTLISWHSRPCPICPEINFPILPFNFPLIPNFTTRLWLQKDLGSNLGYSSYCIMRAGCKTSFILPVPIFIVGIIVVNTDWFK